MLRSDFTNSPEWIAISTKLVEWVEAGKLEALATVKTGNVDQVALMTAYQAGLVDALQFLLSLPERLFSDGEPKDEEPESVLKLKNHPRESRVF